MSASELRDEIVLEAAPALSGQEGASSTTPAALGDLAEAIAERVAKRLEERLGGLTMLEPVDRLVDAATLARMLGVSRGTVYAHADQLGAVRVGDGKRPRLRFDLERARSSATPEREAAERPARRAAQRRKAPTSGITLLPVRGSHPSASIRRLTRGATDRS